MEKRGTLGRVVVIGGNGFLGHHIINQALSSWDTTAVASIDLRCVRNLNDAAEYRECDITDETRLSGLLSDLQPDVVIHTASPPQSAEFASANELFRTVNIDGTRAVVAACRAAGVKALVYTSSASIISDHENSLFNADEGWPVIRGARQKEYYSETKAAAEQLVLEANSPSLLTASLRPAGIFGEGDVQALAGFLRVYDSGKHTVQVGDNSNIFDFTYVGNVAHAHLLAAHSLLVTAHHIQTHAGSFPLDHERIDGQAFFITNDAPCYFWDFARAIWRAAGCKTGTDAVWVLPRGLGLVLGSLSELFSAVTRRPVAFNRHRIVMATMTRYYNIDKAKRLLRYEPLWTLQEGITLGVNWFLQQKPA